MFINRDYNRTVEDDWKLNVQPMMNKNATGIDMISIEVYTDDGHLIGWNVKPRV